MSKQKLLHIYPEEYSFVRNDSIILENQYKVINLKFGTKNTLIPLYFIKQLFQLIIQISSTDKILIQFGGYHSLIPTFIGKIFNIKVFIIVHGTDACSFPEINYGILRKKALRMFCYLSYKYCHKILPVSESLVYTENTYYCPNQTLKFGLKASFPKLDENKISVVYNGVDLAKWEAINQKEINHTFITVAGGQSINEIRKGIDLIINYAKELPNCTFIIVGLKDVLTEYKKDNITFVPKTSQQTLQKLFNSSTFYLQLSIFEGFGLALCEAMLCGCIPIVSNVNIMPKIIGDSGFILQKRDKTEFIQLITHITKTDVFKLNALQQKTSNEIKTNFPLTKRENRLLEVLNS